MSGHRHGTLYFIGGNVGLNFHLIFDRREGWRGFQLRYRHCFTSSYTQSLREQLNYKPIKMPLGNSLWKIFTSVLKERPEPRPLPLPRPLMISANTSRFDALSDFPYLTTFPRFFNSLHMPITPAKFPPKPETIDTSLFPLLLLIVTVFSLTFLLILIRY